MVILKYLVLILINLSSVSDGYGMNNDEKKRKNDQEYQDYNKKRKEAEENVILVENGEKNIEKEINIILFDGLEDTFHLKQCLYCSYFMFNNAYYEKVLCPKCKVVFCWECKKKYKENKYKNCLC